MQEQNFEKQVQQKMDEFSITPSAPVWQKVSKEINQKKDRRRVIFWLLPLFIILGGGLIWYFNIGDEKELTSFTPATSTIKDQENSTSSTVTTNTTTPSETKDQTATIENEVEKVSLSNTLQEKSITTASTFFNQSDNKKLESTRFKTISKSERASAEKINENKTSSAVKGEKNNTVVEVDGSSQNDRTVTKENDLIQSTDDTNSKKQQLVPKEIKSDSTAKKADTAVVITPVVQSKKWQLGVSSSAGISNAKANIFSSIVVEDRIIIPTSGSGGSFNNLPPSPSHAGFSFSAGISAKKALTSRLNFTTGLNYSHFSTRNDVGGRVDADTSFFVGNRSFYAENHYRNGRTESYTNRYHFIELPLGVQYKIFENIPLHIDASVSIAQLFSSNALIYDKDARAYFHNNETINHTQLFFSTGLNYQLWQTHAFTFKLGPYLHYGLTRLSSVDDRKHLISTGIKTNISFKK